MGVWWGSDAAKALQVTAMHMAACMTAPACGDKTPTRFMVCCMATYVGTYLHRYAVVKVAQTEATILLRDGDAVQAHVAHGAPEVDVAREGIRLGKEPRCLRARRRRRRGPDHCKVNMGEGVFHSDAFMPWHTGCCKARSMWYPINLCCSWCELGCRESAYRLSEVIELRRRHRLGRHLRCHRTIQTHASVSGILLRLRRSPSRRLQHRASADLENDSWGGRLPPKQAQQAGTGRNH